MGALDRVFRSRRPSQERPLAALVEGLWRNGEQGVWYDVSDLSTMFQDAAGTLPVYMPGQGQVDPPVGRILDKSGRGNHATQATTTSRPTLSARYNMLTGSETLATQNVTTAATSYSLIFSGTGSVALSGTATGTYSAGSRTITCTAGTLTITVTGNVTKADIRPTGDGVGLPAYQRVVDANTYDTTGFPLYLKFDGVDDFLQTARIVFSGSDKVFCAASFRKLSDATTGSVFELSATIASNPGSFYITAPGAVNSGNIKLATKGTTEVNVATTAAGYPSPISAIASAVMDIAAPISTLRINGVVAKSSSASLGSGSLGNYPLYIGRRAGSSLPFNGRLYGLLIRAGAANDSQIGRVERYLNQKAKVF